MDERRTTGTLAAVSRRAAGTGDDALLRALFADAHDELTLLPIDTREVIVDMQYRARRRHQQSAHPQARQEILVRAGTDVGCLAVDADGDRVELLDITVHSAHRRQGIARAALEDLVAELGSRPMTLHVWAGNAAARTLFTGLGFAASAPADEPASGRYVAQLFRPPSW